MKYFTSWTSLAGTVAIFAFLGFLNLVAINLDFLNVFEKVLSDFRLSDVYFSQVRDNASVQRDENVVIVNIGDLPRDGIAAQIQILNQFQPRAIGVDAIFSRPKAPEVDSMFRARIEGVNNLVLAGKFHKPRKKEDGTYVYDSLEAARPEFLEVGSTAYANLITEDDKAAYTTCRSFSPREIVEGKEMLALGVKLAQLKAPEKTEKFLARKEEAEIIYYKGNWDKYTILDVKDVFTQNFDPSVIKDKVVLLGYLGSDYTIEDWSADRFYTPMNKNAIGRSTPDMYGVLIHANIISSILDETYLTPLPSWLSIAIVVVLCYLNVVLFSAIYYSPVYGTWYDVLTKVIQFFEIALLTFGFIYFFAEWHTILDMTIAVFVIAVSGDVLEVFLAILANLLRKTTI